MPVCAAFFCVSRRRYWSFISWRTFRVLGEELCWADGRFLASRYFSPLVEDCLTSMSVSLRWMKRAPRRKSPFLEIAPINFFHRGRTGGRKWTARARQRRLHRVDGCRLIPGVDYARYEVLGKVRPGAEAFNDYSRKCFGSEWALTSPQTTSPRSSSYSSQAGA